MIGQAFYFLILKKAKLHFGYNNDDAYNESQLQISLQPGVQFKNVSSNLITVLLSPFTFPWSSL